MNDAYVYILIHPIQKSPIYVGKGTGDRAYHHIDSRSKGFIGNKVRKIKRETGLNPEIVYHRTGLTNEEAFAEEKILIKKYGRLDNGTGILYNLTDGGESPANRILSEEHKRKLSEIGKGRPNTWGNKIASSLRGIPLSEERKRKISESRRRFLEKKKEKVL